MKIIVAIILVLASAHHARSQGRSFNISGYIKDAESGESLLGAAVSDTEGRGAVTNAYGYYTLPVREGAVQVTYSFLGYRTQVFEVELSADTVINIHLVPDIVTVDQITVTAKQPLLTTRELGNVSVNMTQLKYSPLFLGEQDIFKYLQLLPGVTSGKEGSSGLNIRGGSADQTQILLDEVPIYNQSHAFGFVSIFNGDAVKSADLHKGYTSPAYGGRLSGLASLRMRDGNRYDHKQAIQVGTVTAAAMLEGPIKKGKGSYIFSGRRFVPDLFLKGYYATLKDSDDKVRPNFSFYDVTAKLSYDLGDRNSLYMSFYTGHDGFDVYYIDGETSKQTGDWKKTSRSDAGFGWGNTIASLRWNTSVSSNLFINTTAYYSLLKNNMYSQYRDYTEKTRFDSKTKSRMEELGLRTSFDQRLTRNYSLNYGAEFSRQFFRPQDRTFKAPNRDNRMSYRKRNLNTLAGYVDNKLSFGPVDINAGVRFARYDNSDINTVTVEPRGSLAYNFSSRGSAWLTYVNNSQPLFSMGQYYFSMPVDYWVPFTEKEIPRSWQTSLGGKYKLSDRIELTGELYYKKLKNMSLVYDSDDFLLEEGGYDVAKGTAYGFEVSAQYTADRYSILASYTYSKSRREVDGTKFPFIYDTPHELNIFGMYDVLRQPGRGRKHTLSVNISYKTGIPYVLSNEIYPTVDLLGGGINDNVYYPLYPNTRLTNYFRTDISYNMEKKKKNGVRNWQISILNATNHKNPYVVYKDTPKYRSLTLIPFMPSFSYKRTF